MAGGKIGDVYYKVTLDADGIPQLAKVHGDKAGKAFGTGMTGSIKKNLKGGLAEGLGIGAALGGLGAVTIATGKLVDVFTDSIEAASSLNEAVSKSDAVFKDSSDEMEAWAETASDAFGQSKRQALEAAGTFGNLIQAFGIGADKAAGMSKAMVELASDLASFNNTSVDEALTALRSGLSGETEPLKRYGVAINDVRLKEEAMRLGLIKTTKGVLPIAIKTQAAYSLILKDTSIAQGDFARTSDGLANTQKTLAAMSEDLSAELGEILLPFVLELATAVKNDLLPALREMVDTFKESKDAIKSNEDPIANLANLLHDLFKDPQEDARTFLGALFDGMNDILALASDINDAWTFWDTYESKADEAARTTAQLDETAREGARGLGIMGGAATDAKTDVTGVGTAAGTAEGALGDLGDQAQTTGKVVETAATRMRDAIRKFRDEIIDAAQGTITRAYEIINDRAELSATNVELAELRKVIATGKATQEQKDRYAELGQAQVQLVVDLAKNGVTAGKSVNTAMNQIRERLKTATGQERIALQATLTMLQRLAAQAILTRQRIALVNTARPTGGRPDSGREHGGPVSAGVPYVVGERRAELFVPEVSGTIIPQVPSGWQGSGGGTTYNIPVTVAGALPVRTIGDIATGMRRIGDAGLLPSATASPQYRVRR